MGDRIILFIASVVNFTGVFVLINSGDWGVPNLLRFAILLVLVVFNIVLHKYYKELRKESLQSGKLTDFAERPIKAARTEVLIATLIIAFSLAGPFWSPLTSKPPLPVRAQIFGSLFAAIFLSAILVWRWKRRKLPLRLVGRSIIIGVAISIPLLCYDVVGLVRAYAVIRIARQMQSAKTALESRVASPESVDRFIGDIVAIDPGHAPSDVRKALKEYIDGFEGQLVAYKLKDLAAVKKENQKTIDALAKLAELANKYD